jgi:acetate kinase
MIQSTEEKTLKKAAMTKESSMKPANARVIRTDEEQMIAKTVCRVLGLG